MAEPRDEIEQLLRYLLPFAEESLNRDGEFRPYARDGRGGRRD